MAKKIVKLGTYHTLVSQLDKLARHNRQGSFRTKARYYEACKRFCAFLADAFHLQKLSNISGKHLVSYVLFLQENGLAANTIKTDLVHFIKDNEYGIVIFLCKTTVGCHCFQNTSLVDTDFKIFKS